jgi:hypothetical protein
MVCIVTHTTTTHQSPRGSSREPPSQFNHNWVAAVHRVPIFLSLKLGIDGLMDGLMDGSSFQFVPNEQTNCQIELSPKGKEEKYQHQSHQHHHHTKQ